MLVKGPKGRFNYKRNMKRHIGAAPGLHGAVHRCRCSRGRHAGMIAGGTGITPMYQTANQILKDEADRTTLSLIYANISEDDILIKDLLDYLAASQPDRRVLSAPCAACWPRRSLTCQAFLPAHGCRASS